MQGPAFFGEDFFVIKEDNDLIRENITRILLTSPGERVMNVDFGSRLKQFIFENANVLQSEVEEEIRNSITRWEPRAEVKQVSASVISDNQVKVELYLINRGTLENFDYDALIRY